MTFIFIISASAVKGVTLTYLKEDSSQKTKNIIVHPAIKAISVQNVINVVNMLKERWLPPWVKPIIKTVFDVLGAKTHFLQASVSHSLVKTVCVSPVPQKITSYHRQRQPQRMEPRKHPPRWI